MSLLKVNFAASAKSDKQKPVAMPLTQIQRMSPDENNPDTTVIQVPGETSTPAKIYVDEKFDSLCKYFQNRETGYVIDLTDKSQSEPFPRSVPGSGF